MTSLARLGLVGRLTLILLALIVVVSLGAIAAVWFDRARETGGGLRVPVPDQIAAIIDLVEQTPAAQRPLVLRALNTDEMRVTVEAVAPPPLPSIRMPAIEWVVNQYIAAVGSRRAVVTAAPPEGDISLLQIFDWRGWQGIGRVRIVAPVGAEHVVIELKRPRVLRLFGLPTGFWVGALGVGLALLAVLAVAREARPLADLAAAVRRFSERGEPQVIPPRGAPDVRGLMDAVNDMQARIAALLKGRTILLGAVSHDLKTHITRLRLRVEDMPDADQRDRAVGDLDAMTDLVDNTLRLARGAAAPDRLEPVDLMPLLTQIVAAVDGGNIQLHGPPVAEVDADPVAIRRLVENLIENARRFATQVAVRVQCEAGIVRVDVDDNGPGIPADERLAVFEPFYRLETSRSRATGGSGLGLAIVRQIAESHGGSVEIGTSDLGGARVRVSFRAHRHERDVIAPQVCPSRAL